MQATVGDKIVVRGHHLGEPDRDAEVLEVHGAGGTPPFLVRWSDDGHVGLYVPGPDARVEHLTDEAAPATDRVRRELREGVVAVRADLTRLRAALASAAGAGFFRTAADEIAHSAARVQCEAALLWGRLRAAEADTDPEVHEAVEEAARTVRQVLDELRVQAALGHAEAHDVWSEVQERVAAVQRDPAGSVEAAKAAAGEVFARLRALT